MRAQPRRQRPACPRLPARRQPRPPGGRRPRHRTHAGVAPKLEKLLQGAVRAPTAGGRHGRTRGPA
eukprot:1952951-Alexandrium_andersonii.AAC.1